eukprot:1146481-Pyramimonas_sp.AAC.1
MVVASSPRPSWTLCRPAAPPAHVQGRGWGEGQPLPDRKGKRKDGRGNSLNHLRPEGWWDSSPPGRIII